MSGTGALEELAALLRSEQAPLAERLVDPREAPLYGPLAASGPATAAAPGEYALVVEAVREAYLLHYGMPRLLADHDEDLALLAGDHLYALGIERLAALGDTRAVHLLAELISDCARLHSEGRAAETDALWEAVAIQIGEEGG